MVRKQTRLLVWWTLAAVTVASSAGASNDIGVVNAARDRDLGRLRTVLSAGGDVNSTQPDGATALHWAAHWNDAEAAELLLRQGARVNVSNDYGVTPLALACINGAPEMVQTLLKAGADPAVAHSNGETPLMTAARAGSVAVVDVLVAAGAKVDSKEGSRGQTALMWAVAQEHPDVVRTLIERRADVNARSASGFTPMMFAARTGNLIVARLLLEAGADLNIAASDGSNALQVAVVRGHVALAKLLLERRADPNVMSAGYTALHWAAGAWETPLTGNFGIESSLGGLRGAEKLDMVTTLLDHGADPNARALKNPPRLGFNLNRLRLSGATAFLMAAMAGDAAVMRLLLSRGADPSLIATDHTTPLMVASGLGRIVGDARVTEAEALEAVKLLLELGADVHAASNVGETAVFGPAYTGSDAILQALVDSGANVNVKNKAGQTPLDIAEGDTFASGAVIVHKSTAALLRSFGATSKSTEHRK